MKKCLSYRKYKGIIKPRCNDGKGCDACMEKYSSKLTPLVTWRNIRNKK
mgnify:CR=1 FL=1